MQFSRVPLALLAIVIAGVLAFAACDGGDDDDGDNGDSSPESTVVSDPTRDPAGEATRPEWFPARFPLPADTTVVSDAPEAAGGGTVEFLAPIGFSRAITIMDLNLETPSHGFIIVERTADETEAVFVIDDAEGEYDGTVTLAPSGEQTAITVVLTPK
jgi:hypothetical protein